MCQIWTNEYNEYLTGRHDHYIWDRFGGMNPLRPDMSPMWSVTDIEPPEPSPSVGGSGLGQQHGTPGY
jgi:hypothetical protein